MECIYQPGVCLSIGFINGSSYLVVAIVKSSTFMCNIWDVIAEINLLKSCINLINL